MPDADTTVAIASFNTRELLAVVCGAVRRTAPGARILVVDTGSTDGSRAWAETRPWLRAIALPEPLLGAPAHAAALDLALARCETPLLCALDSDAVPRDPRWLDALRAELDRAPGALAAGTTKDPDDVAAWRRILWRILGKRRGPEWTYLRPNRALYRVDAVRASGVRFADTAPGALDLRVGEALARALAAAPGGVRLLPPARMDALVLHLKHATLALNPHLFPSARPRDVRRAQVRLQRFLASPLAREAAAHADARR